MSSDFNGKKDEQQVAESAVAGEARTEEGTKGNRWSITAFSGCLRWCRSKWWGELFVGFVNDFRAGVP